jgi:hypothetical protein
MREMSRPDCPGIRVLENVRITLEFAAVPTLPHRFIFFYFPTKKERKRIGSFECLIQLVYLSILKKFHILHKTSKEINKISK